MIQPILAHYLMLNVLLSLGHLGTILVRKIATANRISFKQELKITRFLLFYIPCIYFSVLFFKHYFNPEHVFLFQLPEINSAVDASTKNYLPIGIAQQFTIIEYVYMALFTSIIVTFGIKSINFALQLLRLKQIISQGIIIKCYQHVSILLSEDTHTPFCFSFLKRSYIVITHELLLNRHHYQLAIQHELQHIRQKDTRWLYFLELFKIIFYFNPLIRNWIKFTLELQELACDEALVKENAVSPEDYANCLLEAAEQTLNQKTCPKETFTAAVGLFHSKKSFIIRRITMLHQYKNSLPKRSLIFFMAAIISLIIATTSYAVGVTSPNQTMQSLGKPLYTTDGIEKWSKEAAEKSFTYDYKNYKNNLENTSHYFTAEGWKEFMLALKNSGNLDAVISKKLSLSATSKKPQIIKQGLDKGHYIWQVEIPMNINYVGPKLAPIKQTGIVNLLITRTNETSDGLGITSIIISSK